VQHHDEAIAAQAMLSGLSDEPNAWRDPLSAFRALCAAQERALAGDDDDGFSALTVPF
jgi:hypothetical protein